MDSQRESAFAILEGLTFSQLWERPAPKEWSIGKILDHNYLLFASMYPILKWVWNWNGWYGRLRRKRPYATEIDDLYRSPKFPHWVGFLWTPRHNIRKPLPLERLEGEIRAIHGDIHKVYEDKDQDVLGNLYLYDPFFGWCNLIVTLRIAIYHDQLHYEAVLKQAEQFKQ
jgi:hypothetical protein